MSPLIAIFLSIKSQNTIFIPIVRSGAPMILMVTLFLFHVMEKEMGYEELYSLDHMLYHDLPIWLGSHITI